MMVVQKGYPRETNMKVKKQHNWWESDKKDQNYNLVTKQMKLI